MSEPRGALKVTLIHEPIDVVICRTPRRLARVLAFACTGLCAAAVAAATAAATTVVFTMQGAVIFVVVEFSHVGSRVGRRLAF